MNSCFLLFENEKLAAAERPRLLIIRRMRGFVRTASRTCAFLAHLDDFAVL